MGTLASELQTIARELVRAPRVYADANLPLTLVSVMRQGLGWDVLFVIEHDDLRRAADSHHYRRALDLGRTLITLDHDFLDDRRFPPASSPGVIVCSAPDERRLVRIVRYVDTFVFRADEASPVPLSGRKLVVTPDTIAAARRGADSPAQTGATESYRVRSGRPARS